MQEYVSFVEKITVQINGSVLEHIFPHLLIVFVRFWLNSPPVRKNHCQCVQGQALCRYVDAMTY